MSELKKSTKSFIELTNIKLPITSRLRMFNILESPDGDKEMNIFRSYTLHDDVKNNDNYFIMVLIEEEDWLDNIAAKYYDSPYLWWVVALANDMNNPFEDLKVGQKLKILKPEFLYILFTDVERISEL